MSKKRKTERRPAEGELPFDYDWEPAEELLTAYAGAPLVVRTMRSLGVGKSVRRQVRVKQRQRGLDEASLVESFVLLHALGGDCLEDFERLREDAGLAERVGHELPAPKAARRGEELGEWASACRLLKGGFRAAVAPVLDAARSRGYDGG